MHKPILKTLPNGVRVVMVPQKDALTVTGTVLVSVGSKYEKEKEGGLSHFLEHMCFKGTVKRPSPKLIAEAFDSLGAVSNAFTSQEYTGYYAKGNPSHIETFVDILSDIYLHSTFPKEELEKEKGVIIEEINMYEDMPQAKVSKILLELMYGTQPAGLPILGTKETVSSFAQKDFATYKKKYYTAENTVVVVAGNFDEKKMNVLLKKTFGVLPKSSVNKKPKIVEKQQEPQATIFFKQTDQAHLILAFRALSLGHTDMPALTVLTTILGKGMSSRLFTKVREELGAAYYVRAEQEAFTDHGIFGISAGIDKNRLTVVLDAIIGECVRMKEELVEPKELAKAKEILIGGLRLGLESSDDIAMYYGEQVVLRQPVKTPEQAMKLLTAVTAKDVRNIAKKILVAKHANLAIVGPFKNADETLATIAQSL